MSFIFRVIVENNELYTPHNQPLEKHFLEKSAAKTTFWEKVEPKLNTFISEASNKRLDQKIKLLNV